MAYTNDQGKRRDVIGTFCSVDDWIVEEKSAHPAQWPSSSIKLGYNPSAAGVPIQGM